MGEFSNKYTNRGREDSRQGRSVADQFLAGLRQRTADAASARRNTEGTMTPQQRRKVLEMENRIQGMDYEKAYVVQPDGTLSYESRTRRRNAATVPYTQVKDAVIIHNHPDMGTDIRKDIERKMKTSMTPSAPSLAARVGPTFSPADLSVAIKGDAKGIRVRTQGGYIYNIERGDNGWGVRAEDIGKAYKNAYKRNEMEYSKYIAQSRARFNALMAQGEVEKAAKEIQAATERINAVLQHKTIKSMADRYGFKYTRRPAK